MSKKADFAVEIIKEYAHENGIPTRSTSDLSPMEEWLLLRLYKYHASVPSDSEFSEEAVRYVTNLLRQYKNEDVSFTQIFDAGAIWMRDKILSKDYE